jgi:hypothetical protein
MESPWCAHGAARGKSSQMKDNLKGDVKSTRGVSNKVTSK